MAPKRARPASACLQHDKLVAMLKTRETLKIGGFETRKSGGKSAPSVLSSWHEFLMQLIIMSGTGVIKWGELKKALIKTFEDKPRLNPYLSNPDISTCQSAEFVGCGIHRMMASLRTMALSSARRKTFMKKVRIDSQRRDLQKLVDAIAVSPKRESEQEHVCVSSGSADDLSDGVSSDGSSDDSGLQFHASMAKLWDSLRKQQLDALAEAAPMFQAHRKNHDEVESPPAKKRKMNLARLHRNLLCHLVFDRSLLCDRRALRQAVATASHLMQKAAGSLRFARPWKPMACEVKRRGEGIASREGIASGEGIACGCASMIRCS